MIVAYEALRKNQKDLALALLAQGVKAMKQSALSNGQWGSAWRFMPLDDPWREKRFAGNETELAVTGGFEHGLREVEKQWESNNPFRKTEEEKEKEKEKNRQQGRADG